MFKLVLEKAEEPRDQIANICWTIEKTREFKKKGLNDPNNYDGMVIHLEPDVLE